MMRKMMVPVVVALVLTMVVASGAMAAGRAPAAPYGSGQCTSGVCDGTPIAPQPQDGTGNQYGASNSPATNAGQGDGVCDNVPAQDGTGSQVQRGGGRGR
jgi:hypothetical protein